MPDYFEKDNFTSRRTTGHNLYDPESLLTGAEIAKGLEYEDKRVWPKDGKLYEIAVMGMLTPEELEKIAPRVKKAVKIPQAVFHLELCPVTPIEPGRTEPFVYEFEIIKWDKKSGNSEKVGSGVSANLLEIGRTFAVTVTQWQQKNSEFAKKFPNYWDEDHSKSYQGNGNK